jgi:serine/threonine-protein kinase
LSPTAQLLKHLTEPLPPLRERRPDLPEAVEQVLRRATAKDPAARYPDALVFAAAFRAALSPVPTVAKPQPPDLALEIVNPYNRILDKALLNLKK